MAAALMAGFKEHYVSCDLGGRFFSMQAQCPISP